MSKKATETGSQRLELVAAAPRILLVQRNSRDRSALQRAFERNGFEVALAETLREALVLLVEQKILAMVCDLYIPSPGDGYTLVNAVGHMHPEAVTVIMSSHPALQESLSALLPQADEILVTPVPSEDIVRMLKRRLENPKQRKLSEMAPIATVLERHAGKTIAEWLARVNASPRLQEIPLSDVERTGHLPTLLIELIRRLREPHLDEGKANRSSAAIAHGTIRARQNYSAAMLVEESRILQVCIFKTLRSNLSALDMSLVLTDVMTIADEVDSQLGQTMASFIQHSAGNGDIISQTA